jgi:hypothetical protein
VSIIIGQSLGPILGRILVGRYDYPIAFSVALGLSCSGLILLRLQDSKESMVTKLSYNPLQDARQAGLLVIADL